MKRYVGNTGQVYIMDDGISVRMRGDRQERNATGNMAYAMHEKLPVVSVGNARRRKLAPGFEMGDIAILAILFFLYKESGDEEFLIVLAFFALGLFGQ